MKKLKDGGLLTISVIIAAYFLALFFLNYYRADHFLVGFFIESLTIPFLLAQVIFLIIGIGLLFSKNSRQKLIVLSVIILSVSTILTFGSFFW